MPWIDKVAAVLEAWYPRQESGAGTAAILFGDAYPGGRLPMTFPANAAQRPGTHPAEYPGVDGAAQRFAFPDKLFWVVLRRLWQEWRRALILVPLETVVHGHLARFKLYWKWISRKRARVGRKPASKELRELIFRVVAENPTRRGRSLTAAE